MTAYTLNGIWQTSSSHEIQSEDVEGHLFSFHVKEILKGDYVKNEILINHRYIRKSRIRGK